MHTIARAHAKLILFGEHAAVYGYPAIGISLPWKVIAAFKHSAASGWDLPFQGSQHLKELELVRERLSLLFPELRHYPPFKIQVNSDVPIGAGFGSSGALCVALVRAASSHIQKTLDKQELWQKAHDLEKIFHCHPSGIDTGLSVFEQLCFFRGSQNELPDVRFLEGNPFYLVVGALNRNSNTGAILLDLKSKKEQNPAIERHLQILGRIALKAAKIIESRSGTSIADRLGGLANQAHGALSCMGLSTNCLDAIIGAGIASGATGGKLSGAGAGGAYFLVAHSAAHACAIAKHIALFAQKRQISHLLPPAPLSSLKGKLEPVPSRTARAN